MKTKGKIERRIKRHRRIRAKVFGTASRPRLSVFRSAKHFQLALVDDGSHKTLLGMNDFGLKKGTKSEKSKILGKSAAKKILELGIKKVAFDRGGFRYHGRIKTLAESLREGGLEF